MSVTTQIALQTLADFWIALSASTILFFIYSELKGDK
jgi:hypothetical protein